MRRLVFPAALLLLALAGCQRHSDGLAGDPAMPPPPQSSHRSRPDSRDTAAAQPAPAASAASAPAPLAQGSSADSERALAESAGNPAAIMGAAPSNVSDGSITGQVRSALAADKELRRLRIDVDTENGIVTLSGLAPTASAKAHADEVARTVGGVVSVNNQITLPSG